MSGVGKPEKAGKTGPSGNGNSQKAGRPGKLYEIEQHQLLPTGENERPGGEATRSDHIQISRTPACPKCGNPAPKQISERRGDLSGGFFAPPPGLPKEMLYVYQCQCGTTFTHAVQEGEPPQKQAM